MRENIVIQVGQCGNQTAHAFWQRISAEHSLVPDQNSYIRAEAFLGENKFHPQNGTAKAHNIHNNHSTTFTSNRDFEFQKSLPINYRTDAISTFFQETQSGCFLPRAILCDLEPRVIQNLYPYPQKTKFVGTTGAGNNFAAGYFAKESQNIMDIIRMQVESCDNLASLILTHSVSGGTGSGLGSQLLELLRECFPKSFIKTLSVFPSTIGDIVVQPYNSVLCLQRLSTCADLCVVVDNTRANIVSQDIRVSDSLFNTTYTNFGSFDIGYKMQKSFYHNPNSWEKLHASGENFSPKNDQDKKTGYHSENRKSTELNQRSSITVNQGLNSLGEGYAGINGVIAGTLGMTTAVCRFPGPIIPSIPALGAVLCPIDQLKFVVPSFCCQRTNLMHALGKNFLASTKKGLSIASASILSSDNSVTQKELLTQNFRTTTWNPKTNLCVKTTNKGLSATQLHNHSGITHLFEETAAQFDALKRRNAFVEAYRAFSSDLAIFDEAREVCQQIIDAYKSV